MSEKERWETRYASDGYLFGTEPNAFLATQAARLRGRKTALTVADGEGRNGVWLAEQGLDVTAVDFSPTALGKAAALAQKHGVSLKTEVADITTWRWAANAFDVIVAIFIHLAGDERTAFLRNIKTALKPGGLLLMQNYRTEQLKYRTGGPPDAERLYNRSALEAAFADFSELTIHEHDDVLSEGTAHVGMSALIDLVGIK